ncbi:ecto-ADP-ribosyltransferase 5-like isoform X2 [Pelobates fuscus]
MKPSLFPCIFLGVYILFTNPQTDGQKVQLGMYEDSFDDQYFGCIEKIEKIVQKLLEKERSENADFNSTWESAAKSWPTKKSSLKTLPKGFQDEHGIALLTYTNMTSPVYKQLNRGIREYGADPERFKYHSLHFYLTRALTLLRDSCKGDPFYTYRGASKVQFEPPTGSKQDVRLSQFSSSTTDIKEAQQFGNASFFRITTCYGADIQSFSSFPSQKEVLIPVDEVFHISSYSKEGNKFILTSTNRRCSFYNCDFLGGRKRDSCTYNLASMELPSYIPVTSTFLFGLIYFLSEFAS